AEQVRTAPVGSTYVSTDGAGVGAWVWRRRPTGWVVVDGDTGWLDLSALWDKVLAPTGATWRTHPGFLAPRVRMTHTTLAWDVGVVLTPPAGQKWETATNLREAFGWGTLFHHACSTNWQAAASVTGSDGTIHWAPGVYVRAWAPGKLLWVRTTSSFIVPAGRAWPLSLPGTPT
uniref:hypothetical protein n=1 Tax=Actinomyces faecalis TaxID=2722820 RepID=UPI001C12F6AF